MTAHEEEPFLCHHHDNQLEALIMAKMRQAASSRACKHLQQKEKKKQQQRVTRKAGKHRVCDSNTHGLPSKTIQSIDSPPRNLRTRMMMNHMPCFSCLSHAHTEP
jgi:hypothetical protein